MFVGIRGEREQRLHFRDDFNPATNFCAKIVAPCVGGECDLDRVESGDVENARQQALAAIDPENRTSEAANRAGCGLVPLLQLCGEALQMRRIERFPLDARENFREEENSFGVAIYDFDEAHRAPVKPLVDEQFYADGDEEGPGAERRKPVDKCAHRAERQKNCYRAPNSRRHRPRTLRPRSERFGIKASAQFFARDRDGLAEVEPIAEACNKLLPVENCRVRRGEAEPLREKILSHGQTRGRKKLEEAAAAKEIHVVGEDMVRVAKPVAGLARARPAVFQSCDAPAIEISRGLCAGAGAQDLLVPHDQAKKSDERNHKPRRPERAARYAEPKKNKPRDNRREL